MQKKERRNPSGENIIIPVGFIQFVASVIHSFRYLCVSSGPMPPYIWTCAVMPDSVP